MTTATDTFHVRPYTPHCHVIHDEGAHAVIGISPGNSYFSHQRVIELAAWGLAYFEQVDLVYTDLHVADMYEALGYPPDDARRKAVKNLRGVRAKVNNAVAGLDPGGDRLRGRPMSALLGIPAYQAIRKNLDDLLAVDPAFRAVCDELVHAFLSSKVLGGREPTAQQRDVCLQYVCAEAPLFLDTPAVLDVPSSLNCYHQLLPMAELLYARGSGLRASRNQGHAVVTPADAAEGDRHEH
ncbi:tRNA-dependent cyclodipeptide synthase [Streptomyces sp. NPDC015127]|uniref:tRNA-dependent cyclodipeptide synthase n=1 Tax=Streptomyces sp. NPDC015127 TaxID=3364939 RepID=UPI0036F61014